MDYANTDGRRRRDCVRPCLFALGAILCGACRGVPSSEIDREHLRADVPTALDVLLADPSMITDFGRKRRVNYRPDATLALARSHCAAVRWHFSKVLPNLRLGDATSATRTLEWKSGRIASEALVDLATKASPGDAQAFLFAASRYSISNLSTHAELELWIADRTGRTLWHFSTGPLGGMDPIGYTQVMEKASDRFVAGMLSTDVMPIASDAFAKSIRQTTRYAAEILREDLAGTAHRQYTSYSAASLESP